MSWLEILRSIGEEVSIREGLSICHECPKPHHYVQTRLGQTKCQAALDAEAKPVAKALPMPKRACR